jgi:cell division protein FtsA
MFAVGLDPGSSYTRCVIGILENGTVRFLGAGLAPSDGWAKGRITDQRAVAESMLNAVREAEQQAQCMAERTVLGIGGPTVRGGHSRATVEFGRRREIDQRDVTRVIEKASRVQLNEDRMVLHVSLQDFTVDDHPGHRDPRGIVATRLEANIYLITCSEQEHDLLVAAANQGHVEVEETVFEPLAACYASVMPDERREGVALLDIGQHSTELVVYQGDALTLVGSLPVGGHQFTTDVAWGLKTTAADANLLKEEYGSAISAHTPDRSLIEVPSREGHESREAPLKRLNAILEARATELFRLIRRDLSEAQVDQSLLGGTLLAGGTARLAGICDMAEAILPCSARKSLAIGIRDWPDEIDDPVWTTCAGLMMYSAKLRQREQSANGRKPLLPKIWN